VGTTGFVYNVGIGLESKSVGNGVDVVLLDGGEECIVSVRVVGEPRG
jgi:hypothetical protein